jgi:hypothetical protein
MGGAREGGVGGLGDVGADPVRDRRPPVVGDPAIARSTAGFLRTVTENATPARRHADTTAPA